MTDLHFKKQGKGKSLILMHGGGTDLQAWEFIGPELAKEYEVITYDQRGAGLSPIPNEPTNHVADLELLISSIGIQNVILVGHSLGGQIATDFTLKNPEIVDKLILLAPGLTGFEYGPDFQEMAKRIWEVVPDIDRMLDIMLNTSKGYAMHMGMNSLQKNLIVKVHRENIVKSLTWKNLEQVWAEPPTINKLEEIKSETLFILGKEDKQDLFEIKRLFNQLPNIEFVDIKNADHALTWTHPADIIDVISKFVNGD
ncbi:alpha/beta fold hydrolase [Xanthovirga aplysinae]|uniref:alpha/beta fold hydrolase n=1 Tax=Xanthovirga aplysinae TaxID=2529853 RepID=UPI0012BC6BB9|nr:alpha/beta hydrolase [Xanthovirga aplysinae]MTI32273.1 alpha/beta hydrolase [Xanthovirga aplysinae]